MFGNQTLTWKIFEPNQDGSYRLILPNIYAEIFEQTRPLLMKKSNSGWKPTRNEDLKVLFLRHLNVENVREANAFCEMFSEAIIVHISEHLTLYFDNDELDICFALGMNFDESGSRTAIGEWVYRAKYHQCGESLQKVINKAEHFLCNLPKYGEKECYITHAPTSPGKDYHIARIIAEGLSKKNAPAFFNTHLPLIECSLSCEKPQFKNLSFLDKYGKMMELLENDKINFSQDPRGKTVVLLDDLYQSGMTMWAIARYLKKKGAKYVVGLAMNKTRGDLDNL